MFFFGGIFLHYFSLCRGLQVKKASKDPTDRWDNGDMKGILERKARGEQRDHMDQTGPKEIALVFTFTCMLCMHVCVVFEREKERETERKADNSCKYN